MSIQERLSEMDDDVLRAIASVAAGVWGIEPLDAERDIYAFARWGTEGPEYDWCSFTNQRGTRCRRDAQYECFGWHACRHHYGKLQNLVERMIGDWRECSTGDMPNRAWLIDMATASIEAAEKFSTEDLSNHRDYCRALDAVIIARLGLSDDSELRTVDEALEAAVDRKLRARWAA